MFAADRMSMDDNAKCQVEWPAMTEARPHGNAARRPFEFFEPPAATPRTPAGRDVDRWVDEQIFEEDLRAVLQMMRPHRRERMLGWAEHRTGGADFRITVAWDDGRFEENSDACEGLAAIEASLSVPRMSDVIAALLIGSARADADLTADGECDAYLAVLGEVARRVEELRGSFA